MESKPNTISPDDSQRKPTETVSLFDRFESAYNEIDAHMRKDCGGNRDVGFTSLLFDYERRSSLGSDGYFLRSVADLRNVLVHNRTLPNLQMAIPTDAVVERLERVRDRILKPPMVFPLHKKEVVIVSPEDSLEHVMGIVHQSDFSQFPVTDGKQIIGLLTENGITRWLARKIVGTLPLVDFADTQVRELIQNEEKRTNFVFVRRDTSIYEVREEFRRNGMLEAALITHSAKNGEKLLGLINRWDLVEE